MNSAPARRFICHYIEMLIAMVVGMAVVMLRRPQEYAHIHHTAAEASRP